MSHYGVCRGFYINYYNRGQWHASAHKVFKTAVMLYKRSSAGFACKYFFSFITNIFESFSSDLKNFNAGRKELLTIAVWNTGSMEISNLLHGRLCPPCKSCWRYDLSSFELFSLNIYCSFLEVQRLEALLTLNLPNISTAWTNVRGFERWPCTSCFAFQDKVERLGCKLRPCSGKLESSCVLNCKGGRCPLELASGLNCKGKIIKALVILWSRTFLPVHC